MTTFLVFAFDIFSELMFYLIFIRVILSWFMLRNSFVQLIGDLTDPVMYPFQKIFKTKSGLDFSPIAAMIFIQAAQYGLHVLTNVPYLKILF